MLVTLSDFGDGVAGERTTHPREFWLVLFVQAAWVVLIKPKSWDRHGLKPWPEAAKKRLHHNTTRLLDAHDEYGNPLPIVTRAALAAWTALTVWGDRLWQELIGTLGWQNVCKN